MYQGSAMRAIQFRSKCSILCLAFGIMAASSALAQQVNPDSINTQKSLIVQDIQETSKGRYLYISQPDDEQILPGTYFTVSRLGQRLSPRFQGKEIPIGIIKAVASTGAYILAEVVEEGTEQSEYFFPDYPGVMVGDTVQARNLVIKRNLHLAPNKELSYFDLFVDPRRDPTSFELSEKGKALLREIAQVYGSMRVPMMLIEGHTDQKGPATANQIESYQRALTVSQFLIEELGFDRSRLVAIGLGESEPLAEPYLPDYERRARRITIKVKSAEIH